MSYGYRIGVTKVIIHKRVNERQPELTDDDVRSAWEMQYRCVLREGDAGLRHVAVGLDPKGRELEVVAVELEGGNWFVYHAMTLTGARTRDEFGMGRRR